MAKWSKNKVNPDDINLGNEYEAKDRPSREQLNAIVNNSFYASEASAEALEKANSAFMANGTVARVDGVPQAFLDFDSNPQEQLTEVKDGSIVESYVSSNGQVWYNVYGNGFKEGGTLVYVSEANVGVHIRLPIGFSNNKYTVAISQEWNGSGESSVTTYNKSAEDLYIKSKYANNTLLYVCGY